MSNFRTAGFLASILLLGGTLLPTARANDSAVEGASGTLRRLGGEHKSVRMVRETVRMDLHPKYYETVVDFTFVNSGPALTVKMGFPESGSGDVDPGKINRRRTGGFLSFSTSLDGRPLAVRRVAAPLNDSVGYEAYWVKQVPFAAGQTRRVQVRYRSPYGTTATPSLGRWVSYDFTGGNWRGQVAESTLIVTLREPGSFLVASEFVPEKRPPLPLGWLNQRGTAFSHTWRNWQANGYFTLRLAKAPPGWLAAQGADISSMNNNRGNAQIVTLTVPGKVADALLGYDYTPAAMQADGIPWISLEQAQATLMPLLPPRKLPVPVSYESHMDQSMLQVGTQTFTFSKDVPTMRVEGKSFALPAAPRRLRNRSRDALEMYVPLLPLIKVLGGTAIVDAPKHSLILRPAPTTGKG